MLFESVHHTDEESLTLEQVHLPQKRPAWYFWSVLVLLNARLRLPVLKYLYLWLWRCLQGKCSIWCWTMSVKWTCRLKQRSWCLVRTVSPLSRRNLMARHVRAFSYTDLPCPNLALPLQSVQSPSLYEMGKALLLLQWLGKLPGLFNGMAVDTLLSMDYRSAGVSMRAPESTLTDWTRYLCSTTIWAGYCSLLPLSFSAKHCFLVNREPPQHIASDSWSLQRRCFRNFLITTIRSSCIGITLNSMCGLCQLCLVLCHINDGKYFVVDEDQEMEQVWKVRQVIVQF